LSVVVSCTTGRFRPWCRAVTCHSRTERGPSLGSDGQLKPSSAVSGRGSGVGLVEDVDQAVDRDGAVAVEAGLADELAQPYQRGLRLLQLFEPRAVEEPVVLAGAEPVLDVVEQLVGELFRSRCARR